MCNYNFKNEVIEQIITEHALEAVEVMSKVIDICFLTSRLGKIYNSILGGVVYTPTTPTGKPLSSLQYHTVQAQINIHVLQKQEFWESKPFVVQQGKQLPVKYMMRTDTILYIQNIGRKGKFWKSNKKKQTVFGTYLKNR